MIYRCAVRLRETTEPVYEEDKWHNKPAWIMQQKYHHEGFLGIGKYTEDWSDIKTDFGTDVYDNKEDAEFWLNEDRERLRAKGYLRE